MNNLADDLLRTIIFSSSVPSKFQSDRHLIMQLQDFHSSQEHETFNAAVWMPMRHFERLTRWLPPHHDLLCCLGRLGIQTILILMCLCTCFSLSAPQKQQYIIGGYNAGNKDVFLKRWRPLLQTYLTEAVGKQYEPPVEFVLNPVDYEADYWTQDLIRQEKLDFVYNQAGQMACIQSEFGFSPIVTQRIFVLGKEVGGYGGAIYTSKNNTRVNSISDIKGKTVGISDLSATGGFALQWELLTENGVNLFSDAKQIVFYVADFARSLRDVVSGVLDVTFVPSGWAETVVPQMMGDLKVVHQLVTSFQGETYHLATSTEIVPGLGLAAAPHVPSQLREQISAALKVLNRTNPLMISAQISTFMTSPSYVAVQKSLLNSGLMSRSKTGFRCLTGLDGVYELLSCPANFSKPSQDVVLRGCDFANISCPSGLTCLCQPCIPVVEMQIYPKTSGSRSLHPCLKMQQGQELAFTVVDSAARNITYQIQMGSLGFGHCGPSASVECDFKFSIPNKGLFILEVLANGVQAPFSPVLIAIIDKICTDGRIPDADGHCICPPGSTFQIADSCVQYWTLFPSVIGGFFGFAALSFVAFKAWKWKNAGASRRLIGAPKGTKARQRDLPAELRKKYVAVEVIGSGSFGVVLEAWQVSNGNMTTKRAIKLVHAQNGTFSAQEMRALEREALLMSQLAEEIFLAKYIDSGKSANSDLFYIVMEYLYGQSLDHVLAEHGCLSELDAVKVGLDICSALKALHNKGVIHRDVKPANIFCARPATNANSSTAPLKSSREVRSNCTRGFQTMEMHYKLIDLGAAVGLDSEKIGEHECLMTTRLEFVGTPAYAAPENFVNVEGLTHASDLWSLTATLFHLASGQLPFDCSSLVAASTNIGDMNKPAPDIRDHVSPELRSKLSPAFAKVLAKGLEKRVEDRYSSVDELATDLYGCLVQRGEGMYTAFISYRVFSEKIHATLLYEVLNNTITPAGNRVIVYLDVKRLVKGEDWEKGFSEGLLNSLVAIPMISKGMLAPLAELQGSNEDKADNVAKELLIMQTLMACKGKAGKLASIYPVLIGKPYPPDSSKYPYTGNFFSDGSNDDLNRLVDKVSFATVDAVEYFFKNTDISIPSASLNRTVSQLVKDLFALQAAQLWHHGELPFEEIPPDSDIAVKLRADPPVPALDMQQLMALKAEFIALIPAIHEVIDRAQQQSSQLRNFQAMEESSSQSPNASSCLCVEQRQISDIEVPTAEQISFQPEGGILTASQLLFQFQTRSDLLNAAFQ